MLRKLSLALSVYLLLFVASRPLHAQKTINVPADYASIQAAINASNAGDTILVAPSATPYLGQIVFDDKAVTLRSTTPGGATINGLGIGNVITVRTTNNLNTVIDGFVITGNSSTTSSAGIYVTGAGATIQNNTFTGLYGYGILGDLNSGVVVKNNVISTTYTPTGSQTCYPLTGISLTGILKDANGNAITDSITGNRIEGDGTACSGNGLVTSGVGALTLANNIVQGNLAGLTVNANSALVQQNLVTGNQSGGLLLNIAYGSAAAADPATSFVVSNTFANNLLAPSSSDPSVLADVTLAGFESQVAFSNNIVAAYSSTLGALLCATDAKSGNNLTPAILDHNDIANLYTGGGVRIATGSCSAQASGAGNLTRDPAFTSINDFHLQTGSPAIGAGNVSAADEPNTDLNGNPRFAVSGIDMGAYEAGGMTTTPAHTVSLTSSTYDTNPPANVTLTATTLPADSTGNRILTFSEGVPPLALGQTDTVIATTIPAPGGSTSYSVSGLTSNLYRFTSTLENPDGTVLAVSPPVLVRVNAFTATIGLTTSLTPAPAGQSVTFTVTASSSNGVIPTPITLSSDGATLATLTPDPVTGVVTYSTSTLPVGIHTITAAYAGSTAIGPASTSITQQITDSTTATTSVGLTSDVNPSDYGYTITFTATVLASKGPLSGSILFYDGTTLLDMATLAVKGTAGTTGTATYITAPTNAYPPPSPMAVGTHPMTAVFKPAGNFQPATSPEYDQVVDAVIIPIMTITSSANPSTLGQPVTITVNLATGGVTPAGTVQIKDGNVLLGTPAVDSNGNASVIAAALTRGSHTINAIFLPSSTAGGGVTSTSYTQVVNGYDTVTTLAVTPQPPPANQPLTLTATVAPVLASSLVPTGTVAFKVDGGTAITGTLASGVAAVKTAGLTSGTHTITCTYSGDNTYNPSSCAPYTLTTGLNASGLTLAGDTSPWPALSTRTFTATLLSSNAPVASAALTVNLCAVAYPCANPAVSSTTTNASGVATFTVSGLYPGTYAIELSYAGGTTSAAATSNTLVENVIVNNTSTTLISSANTAAQGASITFNASVLDTTGTASPSGTVVLQDGANTIATLTLPVGTAALNAVSTTISSLTVGPHSITATYIPANPAGAPASAALAFTSSQTSSPTVITITPQSFSAAANPASLSIQSGRSGSLTLSVTPVGTFNGGVNVSCNSPLPPALTCVFAQNTLTLSGTNGASTTLTINTDAIPGFYGELRTAPGLTLAGLVPFALLAFRRRRRFATIFVCLLLLVAATVFTGCGAGKYPAQTPPGTYNLVLTATGTANGATSPVTQTVNVTLIVTP